MSRHPNPWRGISLAKEHHGWIYARGPTPAESDKSRFYVAVFWNGHLWQDQTGKTYRCGAGPGQLREWRLPDPAMSLPALA